MSRNTDRRCLTIPNTMLAELKKRYPAKTLSSLATQAMLEVYLPGFVVEASQDYEIDTSSTPILMTNAFQLEYATHAFHFLCRVLVDTADEPMRVYLVDIRELVDKKFLNMVEYKYLVDTARTNGWDNTSQDPAPLPKEGNPRKAPKPRPRVVAPVAPVATIEPVEDFCIIEDFGV